MLRKVNEKKMFKPQLKCILALQIKKTFYPVSLVSFMVFNATFNNI